MSELPIRTLSSLCDPNRGITYGIVKVGDFVPGGVPVIRGGDIRDGFIVFDEHKRVTEEVSRQYKRTILKGGEIVINLISEPGHTAIVPKEIAGFNVSRDVGVIPLNDEVNHRYVDYYLKSPQCVNWLTSRLQGSVTQKINLSTLNELPIPIPSEEVQDEIVNQLHSLDQKIELNRQTNQTLEQIAQAIFKSWFVDFDPVKAKIEAKQNGQNPELTAMCAISGKAEEQLKDLDDAALQQLKTAAALFPDVLVESELGEIPEGWKVGSIGDIAKAKGGYAFKGNSFVEEGNPVVKIKNITGDGRVDLDGTVCIDDAQAKMAERFKLNDGDLLMAMTGATVAKIGFVVTVGKSVYLNQRVAKFESEKFGSKISWFLYCCFQRDSIFDSVVGAAQGSAQPNISSTGIESTKFVLPSDNLIVEFCDHADSLFRKWLSNINENSLLEENRDVLLPKLLSGKIDLPVDQTTTEAVA